MKDLVDKTLQLRLLGSPKISLADLSIAEALSAKAQAILIYLAVTGQPQPRSTLASLLWGDAPDSAARANLRKALANLREQVGEHLDLDGQAVFFKPDRPYWIDVADFVAKAGLATPPLNVAQLQEAVELYQGDFLAGFYVRHAPDFETWMLAEQARLRELVIQGLHALAVHYAEQGDLTQAISSLRRLLSLEPWREEAHQQLMRLLAQTGQRGAAPAQYEICRQLLAEELGVEPGEQTADLYEQIRAGQLGQTTATGPEAARRSTPRHNLPSQPTAFVGREKELVQIIPHAVNAIFFFAQSFIKESETANQLEPARLQQKAVALKLFTFIRRYPSCWHATQMRAARLQAELEAGLPEDIITSAKAQAKNQTLEKIIEEVLQNQDYGS